MTLPIPTLFSDAQPPPLAHAAVLAEPSLDMQEDAAVLLGVAAGEESALRIIYERYGWRLHGGAMRALENEADVAEVMQDWLVRVWEKAETYNPSLSCVGTWLTMIFRGLVSNKLRARRRRLCPVPLLEQDQLAAAAATHSLCSQELEQIFHQFSSDERRYLDAAVFTCRTHEEISRDFAEPVGTVKTRIRRAMDKLRNLLQQELQP